MALALSVALWLPVGAAEPTAQQVEFFEKKVRPVLVEHCGKCHIGEKIKGHLHLDSRANLLKGGDSGPAIVPGEPDKSLLIKAIRYTGELRMPPRTKLAAQQIDDLTEWVKMGAPWPDFRRDPKGSTLAKEFDLAERKKFWAWQPVKAAPPPSGGAWVKTPLDSFILAKLQAAGLKPARPADRRTLIRRVYFDLIGLPPTPEELEAGLSDKSHDWYEKLVDRLLASPHYGERWARHWLDLVRFAETYGHEFDFEIPHAHEYRDYVIRAFNADVPYNQFVTEHIAGDLLAQPRKHPTEGFNESIIGTGFWYLGEAKHSPVDSRGDEADRIDNQLDVFGKTFLGLTIACARCHDHKFDAISTKDYYALVGYLESSRQQVAYIDASPTREEAIGRMRDALAQARKLAVSTTARTLTERSGSLGKYLMASRAGIAQDQVEAMALERWKTALWRSGIWKQEHFFYPWQMLANHQNEESFDAVRKAVLAQLKAQAGRVADAEKKAVVFADFARETFRDWFVTGEAFGTGPTRQPTPLLANDSSGTIKQMVAPGVAHSGLISDKLQGVLRSKTFVISKRKILYRVAGKGAQVNLILDGLQLIRDPIYGGLTFKVDHGDAMTWKVMDVSMWQGQKAYIEIIDDGPGFVAVDKVLFGDDSATPPTAPNYLLLQMLDDADLLTPELLSQRYQKLALDTLKRWRAGELGKEDADRFELLSMLVSNEAIATLPAEVAKPSEKLAELLAEHRKAEAALLPPRRALAMTDGSPWNEKVHIRGNHKNLGEEVPRRFLEAMAGPDQPASADGSGRLDLARRMTDPANPLLARVMVNRLWKHHFGEGIVRSVDNFGVLGELPTHPELLDWLATEFTQAPPPGGGTGAAWSLKKMHRLMVLSSTYQMASKTDDPKAAQIDPENKLLHRMPIRRLEAEAIRDAMLAVSGRLDARQFGPGVMPFLTTHMTGRGRPTQSGPLDGAGRRSIYINVRRNFLTPMFLSFDYPIPFTSMGKRSVSNVPAQALILMNNPFVTQQAELWSKRVLAEPNLTAEERVTKLYITAFARPPEPSELAEAKKFLEEQGKQRGAPDHPLAWADLCHVLFNVKEFIFIQ
jgi:hypothetical protein